MDDPNAAPDMDLRVLGAALLNREAWDVIQQELRPEDFYRLEHQTLFREIIAAEDEDRWGDITLITHALLRQGHPNAHEIVAEAVDLAAPSATIRGYISAVKIESQTRELYSVLAAGQGQTQDVRGVDGLKGLIANITETMGRIAESSSSTPWEPVSDLMGMVARGETRSDATVPTGFADVDRILQGGFRPGQMVCIAGRPAMGKSTIAMDFARHASLKRNIPGLFVSLEMGTQELAERIASAESGIPLSAIRRGTVTARDRQRLQDATEKADGAPLAILDATDSGWGSIRAAIVSAHRRDAIEFAVIDYLQLVTLDGKTDRMSRQEEVATVSRGIKMLAKRLGITIIAVAQLNRGAENRSGKTPQLSDLRESGAIEQDSDIVGLIHRPDMYDQTDRAGEGDLIIAKQRQGSTGTIPLAFQGHYARYVSMAFTDTDSGMASPYPHE